jgi:hypothetical protein
MTCSRRDVAALGGVPTRRTAIKGSVAAHVAATYKTARCSPLTNCTLWYGWLPVMGVAGLSALTHLVVALLHGQRLRQSTVMRTLLSPSSVPAPALQTGGAFLRTSAWQTPCLVQAVLALVAPDAWGPMEGQPHLLLNSVRRGAWEVFSLGVIWHGRVMAR